jgi:hypothetical protein
MLSRSYNDFYTQISTGGPKSNAEITQIANTVTGPAKAAMENAWRDELELTLSRNQVRLVSTDDEANQFVAQVEAIKKSSRGVGAKSQENAANIDAALRNLASQPSYSGGSGGSTAPVESGGIQEERIDGRTIPRELEFPGKK